MTGKRRQKIRQALLIAAFILFPLVYYYLSPIVSTMGAFEGVVAGSVIVFLSMFVVSLFLGRAYCGWVCPSGAEQELCARVRNKRFKGGKLDWIKYLIWAPWIITLGVLFFLAGGAGSVSFTYQTYHGLSIQNLPSAVIFFIVFTGIALPVLILGRRASCHIYCWMAPFMVAGRKLRNLVKTPALQLRSDASRCVKCRSCSRNCPMSLDVQKMVQAGDLENTECILCGTCADVCPKGAIGFSFGGRGN